MTMTLARERVTKRTNTEDVECVQIDRSLREVEQVIQELIAEGFTREQISCDSQFICLFASRPETDAEYEARCKRAEEEARLRQQRYENAILSNKTARKRLYEQLKAEFENA